MNKNHIVSGKIVGAGLSAALLALGLILLFAQEPAKAQTVPPNALTFFKNYFVTGDYVVGGTSLWRKGVAGKATEHIEMSGVPEDVDILAAFLYVQTAEAVQWSGIDHAKFDGVDLGPGSSSFAKALNWDLATKPCWSVGLGGGRRVVTYRADVLRFLPMGPNGKQSVNGLHELVVPDLGFAFPDTDEGGSESGGETGPRAVGASLVVIYRDPTKPFRAIVIDDGGFTKRAFASMTQTITGFYQASTSPAGPARMTHIVGDGRPYLSEKVWLGSTLIATNPYASTDGPKWDNPTFEILSLPAGASSATVQVTPNGLFSDCVSFSAMVFSTEVQDSDGDGLPDVWESQKSGTPGSLLQDPNGQPLPILGDMGADPMHKDVFIEIGYMDMLDADPSTTAIDLPRYGGVEKPVHSHLPTPAAIKLMGDAFRDAPVVNPDGFSGIKLHVDAGDSYPSGEADAYIIRDLETLDLARGGEALHESITTPACTREATDPVWKCQFQEYPGTVGWKTGFRYIRDEVIGTTDGTPIPDPPANPEDDDPCDAPDSKCVRRFDRNRMDSFHYAFFAHAVGMPKSLFACLDGSGLEVADVDGHCPDGSTDNPTFHTPRTNSGIGDFPGGDILVTLGAFSDRLGRPGGTDYMVASTFFHEFGHNIELRHGAWQDAAGRVFPGPNCVPTYLSVMNYLYQLRGLVDNGGTPRLDFSSSSGPTTAINESSLADLAGGTLWPSSPAPIYRIGWYAPLAGSYLEDPTTHLPRTTIAGRHCDGSDLLRDPSGVPTEVPMVRIDARTAAGDIDWNANGVLNAAAYGQDVNFNGRTVAPAGASAELPTGFNDWANIRLNQIDARRNVGGPFIDRDGYRAFGPLSADLARADWARADWARADWARADWAQADWARADWGDLSQGDTVRYGFARADWATAGSLARADWARADWARADWARADWGRGDDGRGDLGGGDLFVGDPNNPGGELDFETATALAKTPPNEFTACVIGVTCSEGMSAPSGVFTSLRAPNIGDVTSYIVYRVPGNALLPGQTWEPVVGDIVGPDELGKYTLVDLAPLSPAADYTYFAVAVYPADPPDPGEIASDPSNLVTIHTPKASSTVTVTCTASVPYTGLAQTPCTVAVTGADGLSLTPAPTYANNTDAGTASASYTYAGDDTHTGSTGAATFSIAQASSTTTVSCPVSVTYTGSAQTPCTAAYATADGLSGSLTVLSYTANTNVGPAGASATYAGDANHATSAGAATFSIAPASSTTTVSCPVSVTYNGAAQTPCTAAYATADGLSGPLAVSYTANTNVGTAGASATYAGDGNHAASAGSATFSIAQAGSAVGINCTAGAPHTYTGAAQTPCVATASGVGMTDIDVTASLIYSNNATAGPATVTASWGGDTNHTGNSGSGGFAIAQAGSAVVIDCTAGAPHTYTGAAQTPCSVAVVGAGGLNLTPAPSYANNINAGTASASYTFAGDANHTGSTGAGGFAITKATPTFSGLSGPTITLGATPTALGGMLKAGSLVPSGIVSITLNGVTQTAPITTTTGAFSSSFVTGALTVAGSPYTITYNYAGDLNFAPAGPNTSMSLTVRQATYTLFGLQNVPPAVICKAKAGSTVPMKWQFKDGSLVVNSSQVGHEVRVVGPLPGTTHVFLNTDPGTSWFRYDAATKTWYFNLQTKDASGVAYPVGNYNVTITPTTLGYLPSSTPFILALTKY